MYIVSLPGSLVCIGTLERPEALAKKYVVVFEKEPEFLILLAIQSNALRGFLEAAKKDNKFRV